MMDGIAMRDDFVLHSLNPEKELVRVTLAKTSLMRITCVERLSAMSQPPLY